MKKPAVSSLRNTLLLLGGLAVFGMSGGQIHQGILSFAHTRLAFAGTMTNPDPGAGYAQDFQNIVARNPSIAPDGSVTALSSTAPAKPFPHMELYGGMVSSGWPLIGDLSNSSPSANAPLNMAIVQDYARFPYLVVPPTPLSDNRTDITVALRTANPSLDMRAYVMASTTWCPQDSNGNISYPTGTYYRDYWLTINGGNPSCTTSSNQFLWMQDGIMASEPPHNMGINVNLAYRVQQPDGSYEYTLAEQIADTMYAHAKASKNFDGIFIDVYCPAIMWMETPGHLFDYARAGYGSDNTDPANRADFDAGWQAGHQRLADHLRELAVADGHPDYPISGNCAQAPARLQTPLNGWMRENFPFQNAYGLSANFYSNMLAWPWGYLHQDRNFRAPQANYIFTATQPSGTDSQGKPIYQQYSAFNQQKMRFGLGSTSLGNGISAFHDSSGDPTQAPWFTWWYDEYAVNTRVPQSDPNFGKASTNMADTGWLGAALGPAYAYPVTNNNANLVATNLGFEQAGASPSQVPGWQVGSSAPTQGTVQRDTTTAASGAASLRADVTSVPATPIPYGVQAATGAFQVTAYQQYSVTFWAKASAELPLSVAFSAPTNGSFQTIPVDTQWRRYSAVLISSVSTLSASVQFQFATTTGTFWIDDVSVQAGTSAVWRRDFEKGIVLVNPSVANVSLTLEKPYKKIAGTVNTVLNDGSRITQLLMQGTQAGAGTGDAVFLLTIDETPPGSVQDLTTQ